MDDSNSSQGGKSGLAVMVFRVVAGHVDHDGGDQDEHLIFFGINIDLVAVAPGEPLLGDEGHRPAPVDEGIEVIGDVSPNDVIIRPAHIDDESILEKGDILQYPGPEPSLLENPVPFFQAEQFLFDKGQFIAVDIVEPKPVSQGENPSFYHKSGNALFIHDVEMVAQCQNPLLQKIGVEVLGIGFVRDRDQGWVMDGRPAPQGNQNNQSETYRPSRFKCVPVHPGTFFSEHGGLLAFFCHIKEFHFCIHLNPSKFNSR